MRSTPSELRPRRYQLLLPLRVWIRGWGKGKASAEAQPVVEAETITENISSAGCYFLLNEKPAVGSRIEMEIKMTPERGKKSKSKVSAGVGWFARRHPKGTVRRVWVVLLSATALCRCKKPRNSRRPSLPRRRPSSPSLTVCLPTD